MAKFTCSTKEGHPEKTIEATDAEHAAVMYKAQVGLAGIGMPIDVKEVADSNPKNPAKSKRTVKEETEVMPRDTDDVQLTDEEMEAVAGPPDKPVEEANVSGSKALTTRERAAEASARKAGTIKAKPGTPTSKRGGRKGK